MKRALVLILALVLGLGLAAFAAPGFYAEITTNPLKPVMTLEAGLGLWGAFANTPNIGLGLDLYTQVDNILGTDNDWICGFLVSIQGTEITLDLGMDCGFRHTTWPDKLLLTQWDTTATITGHPGDITKVWGTIALIWDTGNKLEPGFELGIRVDIPFGTPF